jgi:hypothetical protein
VVVAVPDDHWADEKLQEILLAGLDAEGVTFTFDLPAVVLGEVRRRGRDDARLAGYLDLAHTPTPDNDRWATGMRALNADAAAQAARGDRDAAVTTLIDASHRPPGFAGYTSATYLALADRCIEIGRHDVVARPAWGVNGNRPLLDLAADAASRIQDLDFRAERMELVRRYVEWIDQPPPDLRKVHAFIGVTPDPDARRAYKDLAAAFWSGSGTREARASLKALVPMVLEDTTTLDAMLARAVGSRLATLPDPELDAAAELVAEGLTSGRPWEMAVPLQLPAVW